MLHIIKVKEVTNARHGLINGKKNLLKHQHKHIKLINIKEMTYFVVFVLLVMNIGI